MTGSQHQTSSLNTEPSGRSISKPGSGITRKDLMMLDEH
jgi:hypothetical protein